MTSTPQSGTDESPESPDMGNTRGEPGGSAALRTYGRGPITAIIATAAAVGVIGLGGGVAMAATMANSSTTTVASGTAPGKSPVPGGAGSTTTSPGGSTTSAPGTSSTNPSGTSSPGSSNSGGNNSSSSSSSGSNGSGGSTATSPSTTPDRGSDPGKNGGKAGSHPSGFPGAWTDTVYVVQPGDTLASVSRKFGISVDMLAKYNQIKNVNLIYANSALRVAYSELKIPLVSH